MIFKTSSKKTFWLSLQFFSQLPTPNFQSVTVREMAASMVWSPVIGLILGGGLAVSFSIALWLAMQGVPAGVLAVFILSIWIAFSKGLHLDGVADVGDAWMGSLGSTERALNIMKDSRLGTGGVTTLVLMLLIKWQLITYLLTEFSRIDTGLTPTVFASVFILILLIPAFARFTAWRLMALSRYAGQTAYHRKLFHYWSSGNLSKVSNRMYRLSAALLTFVMLIALYGLVAELFCPQISQVKCSSSINLLVTIFLTVGALLVFGMQMLWLRKQSENLIGGINGDMVGAQIEVSETVGLILLLLLLIFI